MANLIIKSSADNLVLQGSDASPAITVGATGTTTFAENATLSGTANNLGTATAGTLSSGVTFPAGHVLQVLSTSHNTEVGTDSTTYVALSTPMSVAITPSSTSNKIWVHFATSTYQGTANIHHSVTIYRDSTNLGNANWGFGSNHSGAAGHISFQGGATLDSPNTTSSVTYQLYHKSSNSSNTGYCNINGAMGSITVMEIKV